MRAFQSNCGSYQVVTIRDYGGGYVEGSWGWSNGEQRVSGQRGESLDREKNKGRSSHRAAANVRRICMSAGLDHLLTLTYRENIKDRHRCWQDVARFIRLVRSYCKEWPYVVVPEYQKRGAVHFHLGVKGYQDVALLRSLWRRVVGDGNIDVKRFTTGAKWKLNKLASYLAKYITKALNTGLNEQAYHAAKGIERNIKKIVVPFPLKAKEYLLYKVEQIGGKIGYLWESEESKGWYGWACSWE